MVFFLVVLRALAGLMMIVSPLTSREGSNLAVDCSYVGGGRTDVKLTIDGNRINSGHVCWCFSDSDRSTIYVWAFREVGLKKSCECDESL